MKVRESVQSSVQVQKVHGVHGHIERRTELKVQFNGSSEPELELGVQFKGSRSGSGSCTEPRQVYSGSITSIIVF